jgi:hypothetical protein
MRSTLRAIWFLGSDPFSDRHLGNGSRTPNFLDWKCGQAGLATANVRLRLFLLRGCPVSTRVHSCRSALANLCSARFASVLLCLCTAAPVGASCGDYLMPLHGGERAGAHSQAMAEPSATAAFPAHAAAFAAGGLDWFRPQPLPCDGPQCGSPEGSRSAEMAVAPESRSSGPGGPASREADPRFDREQRGRFGRPVDSSRVASPAVWELLRPPQRDSGTLLV